MLKDGEASMPCTCFGVHHPSRRLIPKNGQSIIARGRPSFYVKGGKLSFNVSSMMDYGQGELYLKFLELKERLEAEGLFDESQKAPIPRYAKSIAVVTSESGAVLHDIINVSSRRNPGVNILVFPAQVQGGSAPRELISALKAADASGADTVIIARGGGSLEDLQPFFDEDVVRAVYAMKTPTISAVGHETDFALTDFAADLRASTPSVAAELAVFDLEEAKRSLLLSVTLLESRLDAKIRAGGDALKMSAKYLSAAAGARLSEARRELIYRIKGISAAADSALSRKGGELSRRMADIEGNNPLRILRLGYAKVLGESGNEVSSVRRIASGDAVRLRFHDGSASALITETRED